MRRRVKFGIWQRSLQRFHYSIRQKSEASWRELMMLLKINLIVILSLFHAQQCVEKIVKASLEMEEVFSRVKEEDIDELDHLVKKSLFKRV